MSLFLLAPDGMALRVAYHGYNMADLDLTRRFPESSELETTSDKQYRVKVYRDGVLVHDQIYNDVWDMYWSDSGLARNRQYTYTGTYFRRSKDSEGNWNPWGEGVEMEPKTIVTDRHTGYLYNTLDNRFKRAPISLSGSVTIGHVNVLEGVLTISPGTVVNMLGHLTTSGHSYNEFDNDNLTGELQAVGVTFRRHADYNQSFNPKVSLNRFSRPTASPTVAECLFDGVDLQAAYRSPWPDFEHVDGMEITDNVFTSSASMHIEYGVGVISGNTGIKTLQLGHWSPVPLRAAAMAQTDTQSASYKLIFCNNQADEMEIFGRDNYVENNQVLHAYLRYTCNNNQIISNTFRRLQITGSNNVVRYNEFPFETGAGSRGVYCTGNNNLIEHNTFESTWVTIQQSSADHAPSEAANNVLRHNFFIAQEQYTDGGITILSGNNNLIYDNFFSARLGTASPGRDSGISNRWFVSKTAGPNIVNGPYIGGNYWGRYDGVDEDGDGFGDTPMAIYNISGTDIVDTEDELPLMGPGEIFLEATHNNPSGGRITPEGQPFPVTRIYLSAASNMAEVARISSMKFTFVGNTNRIQFLAGAALFGADSNHDADMRLIQISAFVSNQVTFSFNDTVAPGAERFYALVYGFRYEDEYTQSGPLLEPGTTVGDIVFGATITQDDIVCGPAVLTGKRVNGYIRPGIGRYLTALPAYNGAAYGRLIENTAQIITQWDLRNEICDNSNPAVFTHLYSGQYSRYVWVKDLHKPHVFSKFPNRPTFRVTGCGGAEDQRLSLPVSEVFDAYLDANNRPRWARGLGYEDPYMYEDLLFDGEIQLMVTATTGNFSGFRRDVLEPLRRAFGGDKDVILVHFRKNASTGGYFGEVRILTHFGTHRALAALPGAPRVIEQAGRLLVVHYGNSEVEDPDSDDEINEWSAGGDLPLLSNDYDGDGIADPAVYDPDTGTWKIWLSSRDYESVTLSHTGDANTTPVPADYDGDGIIDPAVYDPATGNWSVWLSSRGNQKLSLAGLGRPGATAYPADYDGDGKADPAIYAPATGTWQALLSGRGHVMVEVNGWGGPEYTAVPGDYDGDGKADPAVYSELTGTWRAWLSSQNYREISVDGWGAPGLEPVPADYDGDGKTDPAVLDPVSGRRAIWRSSHGYRVFITE